jgi:hypothetical protein
MKLAPLARRVCEITSGGVIGPRWQEHFGHVHARELSRACSAASRVLMGGGYRICLRSRAWAYGVPAVHPLRHDAVLLSQVLPELRRLLLKSSPRRRDRDAWRLLRLARLFYKQSRFIELENA